MMELIAHRVNTRAELKTLPPEYGVELDLRDGLDGRIYLQHDPFIPGEDFEEYLAAYHHGTMILNVKSERVELAALPLLRKYNITRYFFLDSTFPMIRLLTDAGENGVALRFSEFEGLDTLRAMRGRAGWVWVDCFSRFPMTREIYEELRAMRYKICVVSPELEGQPEKIADYKALLAGMAVDAVCTKRAHFAEWESRDEK